MGDWRNDKDLKPKGGSWHNLVDGDNFFLVRSEGTKEITKKWGTARLVLKVNNMENLGISSKKLCQMLGGLDTSLVGKWIGIHKQGDGYAIIYRVRLLNPEEIELAKDKTGFVADWLTKK